MWNALATAVYARAPANPPLAPHLHRHARAARRVSPRTRPGRPSLEAREAPRQVEGRGEGAELAEQVAGVFFQERAQLGRAGDPAGGGEGLAELGLGEVGQRPAVDPLRVRT